jgi:hypothetical protein
LKISPNDASGLAFLISDRFATEKNKNADFAYLGAFGFSSSPSWQGWPSSSLGIPSSSCSRLRCGSGLPVLLDVGIVARDVVVVVIININPPMRIHKFFCLPHQDDRRCPSLEISTSALCYLPSFSPSFSIDCLTCLLIE